AYDVRQTYPAPLNEDLGYKIGRATAQWFKKQGDTAGKKLLSTRDHRPAAPSMQKALIDGILAEGIDVVDLGLADTSFLYFAIPFTDGAIGGVQCTASHNPIEYIGYKLSGNGAKPIGRETGLAEIQALAEALPDDKPAPTGTLTSADLWDEYKKHILSFMAPLPRPVSVYIDASNGCATTLVPKVFEGIPNLTIHKENFEYTDQWVHEPNPLVPANVQPTIDGVKKHNCDLGACFDGDADRCMLVDDAGQIIGCDHLTAWLAGHFAAQDKAASKPLSIVYDLRSSKSVEESVTALGGKPVVSKVGHVNLKANLRENDAVFGGELSGHFYFRDNAYADSGAITLAVALSVLAQSDSKLSDQVAPFRKYPQSGEINFVAEDKVGIMQGLKDTYGPTADAVLDLDGVTIDCFNAKGWWFNVRASNTEPLLRLNAEAKDEATLKALLDELTPKLGEVDHGH
ncbi:MAG: phosphomannomutase/phosphoglucomutase, partial [Planctomycetota bacterium]